MIAEAENLSAAGHGDEMRTAVSWKGGIQCIIGVDWGQINSDLGHFKGQRAIQKHIPHIYVIKSV